MTEYKLLLRRIGLIVYSAASRFECNNSTSNSHKNLSIEEYGIWAQITASIGVFPGLVMLGLPYTIVRFLPAFKKKGRYSGNILLNLYFNHLCKWNCIVVTLHLL